MYSDLSSPNEKAPKRGKGEERSSSRFSSVLVRASLLLSRNTDDPIVGGLRDKKENCSTRRGLPVGTRFREFLQTS